MNTALEIKNLYIKAELKDGFADILKDINITLNKGEVLAILGESGAGKTMLSLAITGLLPTNCTAYGEIIAEGKNILKFTQKEFEGIRGRKIVLMPQGADFLNEALTVKTQLFESISLNEKLNKKDTYKKAVELLSKVGFINPEEILKLYPFQLSGGMAQRVILAMGMAANPLVVIADEPTRGIEQNFSKEIISLFRNCFKDSGVIVITHDYSPIYECDKAAVIFEGEIIEIGHGKKVFSEPKHPYTKALKKAMVFEDFSLMPKYSCKKEDKTGGCSFYTRCPESLDICSKTAPQLLEKQGIKVRCFNG